MRFFGKKVTTEAERQRMEKVEWERKHDLENLRFSLTNLDLEMERIRRQHVTDEIIRAFGGVPRRYHEEEVLAASTKSSMNVPRSSWARFDFPRNEKPTRFRLADLQKQRDELFTQIINLGG